MAEQIFKSPGFFEREVDLSQRKAEIVGVPAGVAGTSVTGPAFVPVTVGSFQDFQAKFGSLDPKMFGPYAVREFLKNRSALTFVRVLGAGSNESAVDINKTEQQGVVRNAGFIIKSTEVSGREGDTRHLGAVQFLVARHYVSASKETVGFPVFTDNDSYGIGSGDDYVYLVRGMIMCATGTRIQVFNASSSYSTDITSNDVASIGDILTGSIYNTFKLVVSSTAAGFGTSEGSTGIKIFTASLDPENQNYISKILNTDPERFQADQHLLYAHFPVEQELAAVSDHERSIAITSGSGNTSSNNNASEAFRDAFGRFDTRYSTPKTTKFISQPYGTKEYDLFHFETISDGANANTQYKISISNLRKSTDSKNDYGTFTVEIRAFGDTDTSPEILEQYPQCTLNPNDENFIARKIGDLKISYNFDAETRDERRLQMSGKYPNVSPRVRIVLHPNVLDGEAPASALPFGFRGFPALKTTETLTDTTWSPLSGTYSNQGDQGSRLRFTPDDGGAGHTRLEDDLSGSIVPPVPYRFKVTRGSVAASGLAGSPGNSERVDGRFYWGTKFEIVPHSSSLDNSILNTNVSSTPNPLISSYTKLLGIEKMDLLVTGAAQDEFNNNKFTLARVALGNTVTDALANNGRAGINQSITNEITGTANDHILETCYIRNGVPRASSYTVADGTSKNRITFATLVSLTGSVFFNKFSNFAKFTNFFYGGFDGVNILDRDMARLNDRATSSDGNGKASESDLSSTDGNPLNIGLSTSMTVGSGKNNNIVLSYRAAAEILTDEMASRVNIIVIPGIRDSAVTDYVTDLAENYSKAIYVIDVPSYDGDNNRLYNDSTKRPDVPKTIENFDTRALDTNYAAAYFPDVSIDDPINNRSVETPASVAVLGALAFSDNVSYPWFAPAGFNRASLDFVVNTRTRLNADDRDNLYESRINPIATFPNAGFVIFGQKTLQQAQTALDRVNVRRMLLEVKRLVSGIANKIVFDQNTPETRARFVTQVTPLLSLIQTQQGIDQFSVVMDESNNTVEDVEQNRLNGRIVLVPTRAVEFIAIDFIITSAGVSFD
tara:strand:- start:4362 stop:7553 length:3192 start_codon:yes stop_codon:yes gene_type:complete